MRDPEVKSVGMNGVVQTVYVATVVAGGEEVELGTFDSFEEAELEIRAHEAKEPPNTKRCFDCGGSGKKNGDECNMCVGTGRVS